MNLAIEAIQPTYYKKKDGTFPIKIQIIWKGQPKYIPVTVAGKSLAMTEQEWLELNKKKPSRALKKLKEAVEDEKVRIRQAANEITANGKIPFSFFRLKEHLALGKGKTSGFFNLFDRMLKELLNEGRIKTHNSYKNARSAFAHFLNHKEILPIDITSTLLQKFDRYLESERGASKNTIAIYMRAIRVVYNLAADDQKFLREFYPFSTRLGEKKKYQIKAGAGTKGDAFTREQIEVFKNSSPEVESAEWEAKQLFLFSYYCSGMNFKDIAYLMPQNISNKSIVYVRKKTARTGLDGSSIEIPMNDKIDAILRILKCNLTDNGKYVFQFIDKSMSLVDQEKAIQQKIKHTNKNLKKLCAKLDLPPCTTYWARHSAATILKNEGAGTSLIQDLLGHKTSKTTEAYLRKMDQRRVKVFSDKL